MCTFNDVKGIRARENHLKEIFYEHLRKTFFFQEKKGLFKVCKELKG